MKKKLVIICGREQLSIDSQLHHRITDLLSSMDFEIIQEPVSDDKLPNQGLSLSIFKYLLFEYHFKNLVHFVLSFSNRYKILASYYWRLNQLRVLLRSIDFDFYNVFLVGRSSGAVIAAQLALEFPVKSTIAIGYPFIHPEYGAQRHRIRKLLFYPKPLYVFQGVHDVYGNPYAIMCLKLPRSIETHYFNTDHEFILDDGEWGRFVQFMKRYLA